MQQFYSNLAQDKPTTKAEALRQAQLSLLYGKNLNAENIQGSRGINVEGIPGKSPRNRKDESDFSHPFYWAQFILIGNGLLGGQASLSAFFCVRNLQNP